MDSERETKVEAMRAKKDPAEPKRSLSAFMLFSQENRNKVKAENPEATFGQLGKLLGEKWAKVTDAEKKKFTDEAGKLKDQYDKDKKEYLAKNPKVVAKKEDKKTTAKKDEKKKTPTKKAAAKVESESEQEASDDEDEEEEDEEDSQ
eukprot:TRINITY_DN274_c0_g1_i5.p1 TRINITY_DN274_c0_g1~~TRINITY_DN274_c0_g1_i5.p1  ORF type:complete len:147 (+),score=112.55 TRINITY_DN274_c0_g1_i5:547-987(+)